MFKPKIFTCLKSYSKEQFYRDIIAGIIVAIIAIPLSVALGIASGVGPEQGLITATIGGFLVSLLGGSRVQVAGPTGAFVVIVYGIIEKYGIEGLAIATIMGGIILVLMGIGKLGSLIKFIPYPITTGFTSGIALVIFSTQIKDFLGLDIKKVPSEFIEKWLVYIENFSYLNPQALSLGVLTICILVIVPRINKKIPGALVAIIITTFIANIFKLDVNTIGLQFGTIKSQGLHLRTMPIDLNTIQMLLMPAVAIALLGGVESLLSAVVADGMIGGNHRSNTELIGQGIANVFSGLLGGIPVTGAIARTSANVKLGGRTPVAGIVHALVVFIIMTFFMPLFSYVPMATLAGILIIVAYNMGEWHGFTNLHKYPKSDAFVFLITFLLTVIIDLIVAIEVGMVLASFLFMIRMSRISNTSLVVHSESNWGDELRIPKDKIFKEHVMYYEIEGPFFFGAADKFIQAIKVIHSMPKVLILSLKGVPTIDATGYYALEQFCNECLRSNTEPIFLGLNEELESRLSKYGFIESVGEHRFYKDLNEAKEYLKGLEFSKN
ncbi:MAG: SulP family inorganic anion transporter [Anaeromicrobium sp.]|jgi:SulP family sulfate permease|uniref:SulP family inorganic anion transporter n=1 Tax=Anaeromicrobium sp. TaxID=1929132 RepID=UPI0025D4C3E4|nr:SulP family inorganic anion transporter [Anaeromicrobium sp.]MCT4594133.1 SulP family inorganic anion transporter [Anaeromicrobium sp.]